MALHSKKLSFTRPIMVSFAGILFSFAIIAILVILSQRKDFIEDYHKINGNFTHNLAVNYTESILRENDYILGRAAMYYARDDRVNQTINIDPAQGLQMLMHLQNLMPTVSSISLADTEGHHLRQRRRVGRSTHEHAHGLSGKRKPATFLTIPAPIWTISPNILRSPSINRSFHRKAV